MYSVFDKYEKHKIQVFLVDLYVECMGRVYERLNKCNESEDECNEIWTDIGLILQNILALSVARSGAVHPNVTVCCIRNLLKFKTKEEIQNVIGQNTRSEQQLLAFIKRVFDAFSNFMEGRFRPQMNESSEIFQNLFVEKGYKIQAFLALNQKYIKGKNAKKRKKK